MRCVNCQFHNMPGSAACGRCGTSFGLAMAAIDVHPPRAGAIAKRVRGLTGSRKVGLPSFDAWAARRVQFLAYTHDLPPFGVLARAVVPGWPQWFAGQRWQGHVFFWSTLVCFVLGCLTSGTTPGGILLGAAFSFHSWSLVDVLNQSFADRSVRGQLSRSILASVALGVLVYWPLARVTAAVAAPYNVGYTAGPFAEGDVLIGGSWFTPRPGRVVLYDLPQTAVEGIRREGHRYEVFEGQRIDRVLAAEGDLVDYRRGVLDVNGRPAAWRAMDPTVVLPDYSGRVPLGSVFILPSTTARLIGVGGGGMEAACMVPVEGVRAVIWGRTRPVSQFGLIH